MPTDNAHDAAVTRFRSICAGEYCTACNTPTIVSSTKSPSPLNRCTCDRNLTNEWRAAVWMSEIPQNSLVIEDSIPVSLTDDGTDAQFMPKHGDDKRLQNHLIDIANVARTKAGLAGNDVTRVHIDSMQTLGSGVSFADGLRAIVKQPTTVNNPSLNGDSPHVEADYPWSDMQESEINHVVQQLKSRASSSRDSYNSMLRQAPYVASGMEETTELRREALEKAQLDPSDFCPCQSTLLADFTAAQAMEDIKKRTSRSAIEWLLFNGFSPTEVE